MPIITTASSIHIGSTPVSKVYIGSQQVWPADVPSIAPETPAITQITVDNGVATHQFTMVANATLYRIETEKVA